MTLTKKKTLAVLRNRVLPVLMLVAAAGCVFAADVNDDLFAAVRKGDAAAVQKLLEKGADVNAKGPYDQTPLFFAADRGHMDIVKLLVSKGADLNRKDTFYNFTAIGRAAMKDHKDIVGYLAEQGAQGIGQLANQAVFGGDKELLKVILDTKKMSPKELTTAWKIADSNKKPELAEMLKAAGAQPPAAAITLSDDVLGKFAAIYQGGRGGTEFEAIVAANEGKLKVSLRGQNLTFVPYSQMEFRCVEQNTVTIEFKMTGKDVTGFVLDPGSQTFTRKETVSGNKD